MPPSCTRWFQFPSGIGFLKFWRKDLLTSGYLFFVSINPKHAFSRIIKINCLLDKFIGGAANYRNSSLGVCLFGETRNCQLFWLPYGLYPEKIT